MTDSFTWLRNRILAERPETVLDIGGKLAYRLGGGVGQGCEVIATGKPAEPTFYDRIARGRWPKVDVVLYEIDGAVDELDDVLALWARARTAARKTVLVRVRLGGDLAEDLSVHRVLPGIVASDGLGLYAVSPKRGS